MRAPSLLKSAAALICLVATAVPLHAAERFDVAVTVDDLPYHGDLPPA